jgi:hypothetical protein
MGHVGKLGESNRRIGIEVDLEARRSFFCVCVCAREHVPVHVCVHA